MSLRIKVLSFVCVHVILNFYIFFSKFINFRRLPGIIETVLIISGPRLATWTVAGSLRLSSWPQTPPILPSVPLDSSELELKLEPRVAPPPRTAHGHLRIEKVAPGLLPQDRNSSQTHEKAGSWKMSPDPHSILLHSQSIRERWVRAWGLLTFLLNYWFSEERDV